MLLSFLKFPLMNTAGGADGGAGGAATGIPAAGGAPVGGAAPIWYDGFEPDLKGYVETKGFKDPKDLTLAYRNLEKLHGVPADQLLRLPKADDADGMGKVYDRLGRPAKAEDYKLTVPQGADGEFAKAASTKFHELGLNVQQAQKLTEWYNQFGASITAKQQAVLTEKQKTSAAELQQKWGAAYEKNISVVDGAAEVLGMTDEQLTGLRDAMGPGGAMEFMFNIAAQLGEDKFTTGDRSAAAGGMTPTAAKARIQQLQQDKEFTAKLMAKNAEATAEWERLHKFAAATPSN